MIRVGFRWLARGSCRHPAAMTMRGGSLCAVEFPAMVGVISHPSRGMFLFDTGYDPAFLAETEAFPERFYRWMTPVSIGAQAAWPLWAASHGIDPEQLAGTIVSHFHGDHIAGLRNMGHLPLYCAQAGLAAVRGPGRFRRVRQGLLGGLVPPQLDAQAHFFEHAPLRTLPADFAPFSDGRDILGDGSLLAVELPGHCAGHWGLAMRSEQDRHILLAADAVWSAEAIHRCCPPPRITTALLGDTARYRQTLDQLNALWRRNRELTILPSHCAMSANAFAGAHAD